MELQKAVKREQSNLTKEEVISIIESISQRIHTCLLANSRLMKYQNRDDIQIFTLFKLAYRS